MRSNRSANWRATKPVRGNAGATTTAGQTPRHVVAREKPPAQLELLGERRRLLRHIVGGAEDVLRPRDQPVDVRLFRRERDVAQCALDPRGESLDRLGRRLRTFGKDDTLDR